MTNWAWLTAAVFAVAVGCTANAATQAAQPPQMEAFGGLPAIEDAVISPDGMNLALTVTDGEQRQVIIRRLADNQVLGNINAGAQKVRGIQWGDSQHLIVTTSVTRAIPGLTGPSREWNVATLYDVASRQQKPLLGRVDNAMNILMDLPQVRLIDGKPYALVPGVYFVEHEGRNALFKVDLSNGGTSLVDQGFIHTNAWLVDAAGLPTAETEYDVKFRRWTLQVRRGRAWKVIKAIEDTDQGPTLMGLGRDGKSVLIADNADNKTTLRELAPDADDWQPPISTQDDQAAIFDPVTDVLIGVYSLMGDQENYVFYAPSDQAIWHAVLKVYPGCKVTLVSLSADHRKIVVLVDSPAEGPAYALVDINARTAAWIGDTYAAASKQMGTVTPLSFKAADGTALTGYLTLPAGREAKALPLVVFPHGGPAVRDEPGFDWWAQAMASRGYAVLQVNYRGSDGFGWDFLSAGFGQWGRKMQTDLSDGVRYLAGKGQIDPARVCIVGASYGGYAALAGATLDPGVYRCAASIAGPSEMRRFVNWSKEQHDATAQRFWLRFMGADGTHDPKLEDISPVDHADRVTIPILLIHGKDDTVVPFEQTQLMADALKRAGKPYDMVTLPGEDHWLSRGATRLQMLKAVITFLEKNNPPG